MTQLSTKLNQSDSQAVALSTKLAIASNEIQDSQDAFRALEAKYDRLLREKLDLEDVLIRERKADNIQISDLQKDLAHEREKRMKLEDEQADVIAEIKTRALELEASLREHEMKVEVLKRDKALLLDELDKSKQREKTINGLWEGTFSSARPCKSISRTYGNRQDDAFGLATSH
jgi:chromosome segregation ATPase